MGLRKSLIKKAHWTYLSYRAPHSTGGLVTTLTVKKYSPELFPNQTNSFCVFFFDFWSFSCSVKKFVWTQDSGFIFSRRLRKTCILVSRWCEDIVLRQKNKTVLSDLPDSDQISTFLDLNQASPVLPLPVIQGHLGPPAAGLTVHVPHPDHHNHAQTSRTAQQHSQLPRTVSGVDVWVLPLLVRSVGWT